MAMTALVVAQIDNIDDSDRESFRSAMDSLDFIPVPNIPMAWAAHYPEATDEHEQAIRREALDAVEYATKKIGRANYHMVVHIGADTPAIVSDSVSD